MEPNALTTISPGGAALPPPLPLLLEALSLPLSLALSLSLPLAEAEAATEVVSSVLAPAKPVAVPPAAALPNFSQISQRSGRCCRQAPPKRSRFWLENVAQNTRQK